jgi:hypothetical protein
MLITKSLLTRGASYKWVQVPPGETLQPEAAGAAMDQPRSPQRLPTPRQRQAARWNTRLPMDSSKGSAPEEAAHSLVCLSKNGKTGRSQQPKIEAVRICCRSN